MTPSTAKLLRAAVAHEIASLDKGDKILRGMGVPRPATHTIAHEIGMLVRLVHMMVCPPDGICCPGGGTPAPTDLEIEAEIKAQLAEQMAEQC